MKKHWFKLFLVLISFFALFTRLYKVTDSPPSPYWEEAALGYDAYSISETGRDHHGNSYPLVAFESFGDWKPAGYFYAIVPFIKLFGLSVLSVRLPSVIAGTGIVMAIGWLAWLFTDQLKDSQGKKLVIISMLLASISPWLIQFSRAGWEVNLATFSVIMGINFGWASVSKLKNKANFIFLILSVLFFVDSMYVYHAARVISPLLGLFLGLRYLIFSFQKDKDMKRLFLQSSIIVGLLLILLFPFIRAWGSPVLGQRAAETTIFSDISIIESSNYFKDLYSNAWWTRFTFHRIFFYLGVIASQFFAHFNISYLFVAGDAIARHSSQYFGLFYPFEALFLLIGSWFLLKYLSKDKKAFLLFWIIVGVLPAAISTPVPHALRTLPIAPAMMILTSFGAWKFHEFLSERIHCFIKGIKEFRKKILWLVISGAYLLSFVGFYRHLLFVYPNQFASDWQFGYEQMISEVETLKKDNPELPAYITRQQGRPAMYYWFYTKTDPKLVQRADETSKQDQGEYLEFENIKFVNSIGEVVEQQAIVADFEDGAWNTRLIP